MKGQHQRTTRRNLVKKAVKGNSFSNQKNGSYNFENKFAIWVNLKEN